MSDPGLLGWLLRHVREHGNVPEGAQVYVDGVELTSTGDELLDALGFRDADVKITVRLPPDAEMIELTISNDSLSVESWGKPPPDG